jgi:hypothetical protein
MQISFIKLGAEEAYIAFISYERHRNAQDVAGIMYSEDNRAKILSCKAIIIRPPVDIPIKAIKDESKNMQPIVERFSFIPMYVLYSKQFRIKLSKNINKRADSLREIDQDTGEFIKYLRKREMQQFIIDSSAIIRAPTPDTYFRTPSQEYSHSFLRVGNIQTSRHVLDSIFFWSLPFLEKTGAILTDSWSISSTTFNISRLLARYVEGNMEQVSQMISNFHVNMLSTHYHGLREIDRETRESLAPLQYKNNRSILFIISAVKTTRSLGNIKKAIKAAGFTENVAFLSLYNLVEDVDIECLCQLDKDFCQENNISFNSIKEPPVDRTIIPIDEQSFFPLETKDELIVIKKAGADISKEFFEIYGGKGVISLHREAFFDNITPLRHHGIYVDITSMLHCDSFLKKLFTEIEKIPQIPACIIYPPHQQGHELVQIIRKELEERFNQPIELFCFSDLEILPESRRKEIVDFLKARTNDEIVLVVDDVSITGDRLHTYQKNLLYNYRGKIRYLVGVARPESDVLWKRRKAILQIAGSTLDCVEMIILPDWNHTTCPWCQEKEKLKELLDNVDYAGLAVINELELRLNDLNRAERKGLVNNAFFKLGIPEKPSFKGESVFCAKSAISEADLAASIASTIQHLRNRITNKNGNSVYSLSSSHPLYSIIDPSDFLNADQRYFEPLIKACILRTAKHRELYATEDKNRQQQKQFIQSFLNGTHLPDYEQTFFIYELYLAMKLGKIPKPNISEHLRHIIDSYFRTGKALPVQNYFNND